MLKSFTAFLIILVGLSPLYAENDLNFKIPTPANAKSLDSKEFTLGGRQILAELYGCDKTPDEVSDFYRNFFQEQGFQKKTDKPNVKTKKQFLRFKKNELVIDITVYDKQGQTEVGITKYLEPAGEPSLEKLKPSVKDSIFTLPKEDLPGKDITGISRPPESVRISSMDFGKSAQALYTTTLNAETTSDFYRKNMASSQWVLSNEIATKQAADAYKKTTKKKELGIESFFSDGESFEQIINDSYVLNFYSGKSKCQITIFPNFLSRELGSMVQISYNEESR